MSKRQNYAFGDSVERDDEDLGRTDRDQKCTTCSGVATLLDERLRVSPWVTWCPKLFEVKADCNLYLVPPASSKAVMECLMYLEVGPEYG